MDNSNSEVLCKNRNDGGVEIFSVILRLTVKDATSVSSQHEVQHE